MIRKSVCFSFGTLLAVTSIGADLRITSFHANGSLSVTNTYAQGVVTIMRAPALNGPWTPFKNAFSIGP
ncbi:MAG TPA: hypothetical protein VKM56_12430, partial [Verrucomicrobiae bacterium]|nr:hypothetical protein [Verrucomicrobiae bacterium]